MAPPEGGKAGPAPLIFSIQHFCLHDGPGTRSIVFFKGCPLRCLWCQNPESWSAGSELAFKAHLCIGCKGCLATCPQQAFAAPGEWDRGRCDHCLACVEQCPSGALAAFGQAHTPAEVMAALRPEFPLYRRTGGGVTFSGGEPTLFAAWAAGLAAALRAEGVPVALETCGWFDLEGSGGAVGQLLALVDLVLFDLKVFDQQRHRMLCGRGNQRIKDNLQALAARARGGVGPALWPRLPLVPGHTDGADNLRAWAGLLRGAGISWLTLVPYHNLGQAKRAWLGLPEAPAIAALGEEDLQAAHTLLAGEGIACYQPGEEDWPLISAAAARLPLGVLGSSP